MRRWSLLGGVRSSVRGMGLSQESESEVRHSRRTEERYSRVVCDRSPRGSSLHHTRGGSSAGSRGLFGREKNVWEVGRVSFCRSGRRPQVVVTGGTAHPSGKW